MRKLVYGGMRNRATLHIIDNNYFGDEYTEQGLVILFKRVSKENQFNETICQDIIDVIKNINANVFISDVINQTSWDDRVSRTIEKTLYLRKEGEYTLNAENIDVVRNKRYEELFVGDKLVAIVKTGKPNYVHFVIFVVTTLIAVFLGVKLFVKRLENKRIYDNQMAYSADINNINRLDSLLVLSTDSIHAYSQYVSIKTRNALANQIDSLRNVANVNYENTKTRGRYNNVDIDELKMKETINLMVYDAKTAEHEDVEKNRISNNNMAYAYDIELINRLKCALSSETDSSLVFHQFIEIEKVSKIAEELDSFSNVAAASLEEVKCFGVYKPIQIDSISVMNAIREIVEKAQSDYGGFIMKSQENQEFDALIKAADEDYKLFYKKGDEKAASRAIRNYDKALGIKYDSSVVIRRDKLMKALNK